MDSHDTTQDLLLAAVAKEDLITVHKVVNQKFKFWQSRQILIKDESGLPLPRAGDYPAYLDSIAAGNVEMMALVLKAQPDLGCMNDEGDGPLQLATRIIDHDVRWCMVKLLMGAGVSPVNEHLKFCVTSIHEAVRMDDIELVKLYVASGANINCLDFSGMYSPIHFAVFAAMNDDTKSLMIQELVNLGANINVTMKDGSNVLHYLCKKEKCTWKLLKYLLDLGAKMNIVNKEKTSPLALAVAGDKYELVEEMIKAGADINLSKQCTGSPLQIAVSNNNIRIVELLIKKRANVHLIDEDYKNILHYAALYRASSQSQSRECDVYAEKEAKQNIEIIKMIVAQGVPLDGKGYGRYRPFESAISSGNFEAVKLFVKSGSSNIQFPIHRAAFSGNDQIMDALESMQIYDVNEWNDSFLSPLYIAVSHRNFSFAKKLIELGANFDIACKEVDIKYSSDPSWRTCLSKAMLAGRLKRLSKAPSHSISHFVGDPNVVRLLLSVGANINAPNVYSAMQIILSSIKNPTIPQHHEQNPQNDIKTRDEHASQIITCLISQIALMRSQNYNMSTNLERLLSQKIPNYVQCTEMCLKELKLLKSITLFDNITLYNLLNRKNLTQFVNNQQIVELLESSSTCQSYKFYGSRLLDCVSLARAKRAAMDKAKPNLSKLLGSLFTEVDLVLYKIMIHLQIKDLLEIRHMHI